MLPVDAANRMRALREWQRLLDSAFRLPGTSFRFGWDPIVGLVPWLGDLLGALMSLVLVLEAHRIRVPRIVLIRMLANIGIDVIIGIVPVVGDAADFFWKSNARNLALLERHVGSPGPATVGDWIFLLAMVAAVLVVAVAPVILMYWILHALLGRPLI